MKPLATRCLVTFGLITLFIVSASAQAIPRISQTQVAKRPPQVYTPSESEIYCAGFITDKPPIKGLFVVAGEEGGLKQLFTDRDTVFLSRGAGFIVNPGGEY